MEPPPTILSEDTTTMADATAAVDSGGRSIYQLSICVLYALCIVPALVGNGYVVLMLARIFNGSNRRLVQHTYIYLLALSLTDLVYAAFSLTNLYQLYFSDYCFGGAVCLLTYVTEGMNKTLSIYLLMIMSADRFLGVCLPVRSLWLRSVRRAIRILLFTTGLVLIGNIPIFASSTLIDVSNGRQLCNLDFDRLPTILHRLMFVGVEGGGDVGNVTTMSTGNAFRRNYTTLLFAAYFVIPAALISFFYAGVVLVVIRHQRKMSERAFVLRRSRAPSDGTVDGVKPATKQLFQAGQVARNVARVVAFYFACWTPYWLSQMLIVHGAWPQRTLGRWSQPLALLIHSLPLVNSAINPVFYAFLNRSLVDAYAAAANAQKSRKPTFPERSAVISNEFSEVTGGRSCANASQSLRRRCSEPAALLRRSTARRSRWHMLMRILPNRNSAHANVPLRAVPPPTRLLKTPSAAAASFDLADSVDDDGRRKENGLTIESDCVETVL